MEEHPFWEGGGLVWCEPEDHPFFRSVRSDKCLFFYSSISLNRSGVKSAVLHRIESIPLSRPCVFHLIQIFSFRLRYKYCIEILILILICTYIVYTYNVLYSTVYNIALSFPADLYNTFLLINNLDVLYTY